MQYDPYDVLTGMIEAKPFNKVFANLALCLILDQKFLEFRPATIEAFRFLMENNLVNHETLVQMKEEFIDVLDQYDIVGDRKHPIWWSFLYRPDPAFLRAFLKKYPRLDLTIQVDGETAIDHLFTSYPVFTPYQIESATILAEHGSTTIQNVLFNNIISKVRYNQKSMKKMHAIMVIYLIIAFFLFCMSVVQDDLTTINLL